MNVWFICFLPSLSSQVYLDKISLESVWVTFSSYCDDKTRPHRDSHHIARIYIEIETVIKLVGFIAGQLWMDDFQTYVCVTPSTHIFPIYVAIVKLFHRPAVFHKWNLKESKTYNWKKWWHCFLLFLVYLYFEFRKLFFVGTTTWINIIVSKI